MPARSLIVSFTGERNCLSPDPGCPLTHADPEVLDVIARIERVVTGRSRRYVGREALAGGLAFGEVPEGDQTGGIRHRGDAFLHGLRGGGS